MPSSSEQAQVLVIHRGARHRYAVPRLLELHGRLAGFYTDSHADSLLGRAASLFPPSVRPPVVNRLLQRVISGIPQQKIKAWDELAFHDLSFNQQRSKEPLADWLARRDLFWYRKLKQCGFQGANVLYSMSAENLKALEYANQQSLGIIVDAFIDPRNVRVMAEEKRAHGMTLNPFEREWATMEQHYAQIYRLADVILCPATAVAEGVEEICPEVASRIEIVPYGSSLQFKDQQRCPEHGRILWAGGDWLRKGLVYLARATDALISEKRKVDIRIAGISDLKVINDPQFHHLRFLGRLAKGEFEEELLKAHMFVLPTLSEGMAGVVIEALAAGCPVIATRESGVDGLVHEDSGLLVPMRDSHELTQAIVRLLDDPMLTAHLSERGRVLASTFQLDAWGTRLAAVVDKAALARHHHINY